MKICDKCGAILDESAETCACGAWFRVSPTRQADGVSESQDNSGSHKSFSIARTTLFITLALYCLGDFVGFFGAYGQFRHSGISPSDLFDPQKYPLQASILYSYLVSAAICILLLRLFHQESSSFPLTLLIYYIIAIGMPIFVFTTIRHSYGSSEETGRAFTSGAGTVIRNSVLLLPWVLYSFFSKTAKKTYIN